MKGSRHEATKRSKLVYFVPLHHLSSKIKLSPLVGSSAKAKTDTFVFFIKN